MFYQFQHFGISEYFCKEYGENFSFPVHLHQSFEFIYVADGEMKVTVNGRNYDLKKGEAVLVFPNQLHSMESTKSRHMLCSFSPELIKAFSSKHKNRIPVENRVKVDGYIIRELDNILENTSSVEKKAVLYPICAAFEKGAVYEEKPNYEEKLLNRIFSFVEQNFDRECDLGVLAEQMGYSYAYLSRCFKKITGMSFNNYVNRYRINNACYLLNNTDCTILQCAMDCGYKSVRSFNRNFMNIVSVTPKEYRERVHREI